MKSFQIGNSRFQWNRSGRCYTLALLTQKDAGAGIVKRKARIFRLRIAPHGGLRIEWHHRTQTLQKISGYGQ
ncbi:hypothetical protein [Niabella sp.]|uniref:hypothetical protein n=1 Tax=Niabella sp. TaxID=1962976 RepID=UPI00261CE683|nr:hypothetical protein [Niabella sp.]